MKRKKTDIHQLDARFVLQTFLVLLFIAFSGYNLVYAQSLQVSVISNNNPNGAQNFKNEEPVSYKPVEDQPLALARQTFVVSSSGNFLSCPESYSNPLPAFTASGTVIFDTDALTYGNLSGGTDIGGVAVFLFESVNVPAGSTIRGIGSKPLAILSMGTFNVGGIIHVDGSNATPTAPNCQARTASPGGAGGGDGGLGTVANPGAGQGGFGPGGGGGGPAGTAGAGAGGHGGIGGAGGGSNAGLGGISYGDLFSMLQGGSGGGGAGTNSGTCQGASGGGGGGALLLQAPCFLTISGTVRANGGNGNLSDTGASGGGSGGAVVLRANAVNITGSVQAKGGNGGNGGCCGGGGGGGGGRVLIYNLNVNTGSTAVNGGNGGSGNPGASGGNAGVVNISTISNCACCLNPDNGGVIAAEQSVCLYVAPNALTSTMPASGEYGTLEYRWQQSTTSSSMGFSDIAGASGPTYAPGPLAQTTWFKRLARVGCKANWTGAAESNVIKITVYPAPSLTCPVSQTRSTDPGQCTASVTYAAPTTSNNCASVMWVSGGSTPTPNGANYNSTFPKGPTIVTWKATDGAGLTKTCTFRITVNDQELPVITCPASQSVNVATGMCTSAAINYTTPTATDNCMPAPTVVRVGGPASGSSFPKGITNVIWRATDATGNLKTCSFSVTVTDNIAPTITCPPSVSVNGSVTNGVCSAVVTYPNPTATDNCTVNSVILSNGLASGSNFPAGATTNTWRAMDDSGLTSICTFSVTVSCGGAPQAINDERGRAINEEARTMTLRVAPNPASERVQILIENMDESGGELTVYDALGRVALRQKVLAHQEQVSFDLSEQWLSGLYWVTLRSGGQTVAQRLVVNRQ